MKMHIVLIVCLLFSCNEEIRYTEDRIKAYNELLEVDATYAALSSASGFKTATMQYMDMAAVLISRDDEVKNAAEMVDFLSTVVDDFSMKWDILGADVYNETAGYTYGNYTLQVQNITYTGAYVTVWKKGGDGTWKFTLSNLPDIIMALSE